MTPQRFHLAQANVARMRGPLESPVMEGFRSQLERINAVADASPGFVWRLQTPEGDATSVRVFDDERILFNMSVWDSLEALHGYVYQSEHLGPLRSRRDWFEPVEGPSLVLWWVPSGHIPTIEEARERRQRLNDQGPTVEAFTFRQPFPAPGQPRVPPPEVDAEFCGSSSWSAAADRNRIDGSREAPMTKAGLVSRRTALKALGATAGAAAVLPFLSEEGLAAYAEVQKARAAPVLKVLSPAQYTTVEALVEILIPADEHSPGAKEARVADYLDLLLSEAEPPLRTRWLDGLAALDAEANKRFARGFVKLDAVQVDAILGDASRYETAKPAADPALDVPRNDEPKPDPPQVDTLLGDVGRHRGRKTLLEEFFANTKQATIHGYYTSEIGIHQELRYKGNKVLLEFVGCATVDGQDCPHCGEKAEAR